MIVENILTLRKRIARACSKAGRRESEVVLLAVSKTFSAEQVRDAVGAGVHDVGENYVQELVEKQRTLAGEEIRWHFIGHLQKNKVKHIVRWIHLVHSVENVGLAAELDKHATGAGRILDVLVEVNTTNETSKFGVRPRDAADFVRMLEPFSHLNIAGLMTIGPFLQDPEGSRPMFRTLRELRDTIARTAQANASMTHLSMGMTGDFEVAIEEGSTIVRLGTAIFGSRRKTTL